MSIGSYAAYAMGLRLRDGRLPAARAAIVGVSIPGIFGGLRMLDGLADLGGGKSRLISTKLWV